MQNYKEINGNDYVKDSRTTINETMRSIQSMNSGTSFPTVNLFEGMKCYRTDLKKTYTLTDVENNTWAEDAHAALADTASKLATARKINITGNATGAADFDGSGDISINTTVNESKHAGAADSATTANSLDMALNAPTSANVTYTDGKLRYFLATENMSEGLPSGGTGPVINLSWPGSQWNSQITVNSPSGHIQTRTQNNRTWGGWRTVLDSENYNNYAPTLTGTGASGSWNINAATATKLATPRTISLTGNASGSASFDGSGNISINTNVNNSAAVGNHAESDFLRYRGATTTNDENTLWDQIGIKEYNNVLPESLTETYTYGSVISFPSENNRLDVWYDCYASNTGTGLYYRTGWQNEKRAWACLLDSSNYNNFVPTKTGSGASGTWPISISGSADTVDGYHASDIINSITAANTGGIVAASLTENGYVKFANGLILQWGTRTEPKVDDWVWVTTTFPIAFASACFSVTCCDELTSTYDGEVESFVRNIKTNSVDIRYRSDHLGRNLRWLALGV